MPPTATTPGSAPSRSRASKKNRGDGGRSIRAIEQMRRGIAGILCLHAEEALRQQHRGDRQRRRAGDLRGDEDALQALPGRTRSARECETRPRRRRATATSAGTLPQSMTTRRPPRNAIAIAVTSRPTSSIRGSPAGPDATRSCSRCRGHQEAGDARGEPEREVLGQELPDQSAAAGAERGAHRQLAAPPCGARGEQAAGVRAGNRQQRQHRAEAEPESAAGAGADDVIEERRDADVEIPVDVVLDRATGARSPPSPPRVVDADAAAQPAEDFEAVAVANRRGARAIAASPRAAATSASRASATETTAA